MAVAGKDRPSGGTVSDFVEALRRSFKGDKPAASKSSPHEETKSADRLAVELAFFAPRCVSASLHDHLENQPGKLF